MIKGYLDSSKKVAPAIAQEPLTILAILQEGWVGQPTQPASKVQQLPGMIGDEEAELSSDIKQQRV